MEIRGYGVVWVVRGYGVELVVHGGYEVEVHGYGEVFRGYEVVLEVVQRDFVEVCGCVDHMDLAEIAEDLEVDHADDQREAHAVEDYADVQREDRVEVDHVDDRREGRVCGEDLVPAAVVC